MNPQLLLKTKSEAILNSKRGQLVSRIGTYTLSTLVIFLALYAMKYCHILDESQPSEMNFFLMTVIIAIVLNLMFVPKDLSLVNPLWFMREPTEKELSEYIKFRITLLSKRIKEIKDDRKKLLVEEKAISDELKEII